LALCSQNSYTVVQGFDARLANQPFLVLDFRALALSVERQSARKSTRSSAIAVGPRDALC